MYSNPYNLQLQSRPELVKYRAEQYAKSKDVLETSQLRLEKEIFLRFQEGKLSFFHGKLVIIAKLGKYLFFAIALPPYIFCYGFPKWLFTKILPDVYRFIEQPVKQMIKRVLDVAHHFAAVLKSYGKKITSPILKFVQTGVEHTRELFSYLKEKSLYRWNQFASVGQKLAHPFVTIFKTLQGYYVKYSEFKASVRENYLKFRRTMIYLPNTIQDKLQEWSEVLKNKFHEKKQPFLNIARGIREALMPLYRGYQKVTTRIDRGFESVSNACRRASEAVKETFQKTYHAVTDPIVKWYKPKYQRVADALAEVQEMLRNAMEKGKEKLKKRWDAVSEKVQETTKTLGKAAVFIGQEIAQIVPLPVISFFTPIVSLMHRVSRFRFSKQKVGSRLNQKVAKLREKLSQGYRFIRQWGNRAKGKVKGVFKGVMHYALIVPSFFWRVLTKIARFLSQAFRGLFFLFRLMLAWIRVFIRIGIKLVKDETAKMLSFHME